MKNSNNGAVILLGVITGILMGIIFITFLILKLCNVVTWSWWWITAPIWAPYSLILTFIAAVVFLSSVFYE